MNNRNLKNVSFWALAFRLGIIFVVIVMIVQFIWEWIATGNLDFISNSFKTGSWLPYIVSRIFFGAIYGLVSAYFLKRNAVKK